MINKGYTYKQNH